MTKNFHNSTKARNLRIHGDNILECERALELVAYALNKNGQYLFLGGSPYAPIYKIVSDEDKIFLVQLFPGYDRWGINIKEYLATRGAPLREAADAIITELKKDDTPIREEPLLSFEFSGALPAGNNAWQRTGRALASAYASIPYLYFAEIGGAELGPNREIKARRFPNPMVPFSYLSLSNVEKSLAIPVFVPSPSIDETNLKLFEKYFGRNDAIQFLQALLLEKDTQKIINSLIDKTRGVVGILASQRIRRDTLTSKEWSELTHVNSGIKKTEWLVNKKLPWKKKTGIKSLTTTFKKLLKLTENSGAVSAGSSTMPINLIPASDRKKYAEKIKTLYGNKIDQNFVDWIANNRTPLLCVWIAGFKPRGDDSRPDRGLVPLARMMFGRKIDLLSIVYGPAKKVTWDKLQDNMHTLVRTNGLWEAVLGLSNAILIDSSTGKDMKKFGFIMSNDNKYQEKTFLKLADPIPNFGEHDVDSVIHFIFTQHEDERVFEGMCNPPGGDWSGISVFNPDSKSVYRWTSLPRVSGKNTKRPDHLIQCNKTLLVIESKDKVSSLEEDIGNKLKNYLKILFKVPPIAVKKLRDKKWKLSNVENFEQYYEKVISGVAFRFEKKEDLYRAQENSGADIIFGVELPMEGSKVVIHLLVKNQQEIKNTIEKLIKLHSKFIGLQVY